MITRMILGGAQENTLLTCEGLVRRGHDVLLLTGPTEGPEGELLVEASRRGVPVEEVPALVRPVSPLRDLAAYRDLRRRLGRLAPRVVHTHSSKAGFLGRLAARAVRVPAVVHTIHGLPFHPYQGAAVNRVYALAERFAARRCDRIISVADAMTRQAMAAGVAGPEKFVTIYSGMEVEPFLSARSRRGQLRDQLGFAPKDFVIAKLARLFELKGHDHLLATAPKVCARHPEARFLLIGDGVLRPMLEAEFSRLGLADRVTFAGLVPAAEVPGYLACSDLLVHASMREGLPRAVPQALLTGTPVVAFALDGTPEIVRDGQTGLLVRAGDREALADAILRMIEDPALARSTAAAGKALAAEVFPAERMVGQILDLYQELLAGGRTPPA